MKNRWPTNWGNPTKEEILKILKRISIVFRQGKRLFVIDQQSIDPFETNITCKADIQLLPGEVTGLKVRLAYTSVVPICGRFAQQIHITAEDIFGNISPEDLPPGSLVEVQDRFVKVVDEEGLGSVWRTVIIVYEREKPVPVRATTKKVAVVASMAHGLPDNTVVPEEGRPAFEIEIPCTLLDRLRNRASRGWYEPVPGYPPLVIHDSYVKKKRRRKKGTVR